MTSSGSYDICSQDNLKINVAGIGKQTAGERLIKMAEEDKGKAFRELGYFASLGISVALAIVIGLALGYWLDTIFDTKPVLLLMGLGFGIAAGFSNIIRAGKKAGKY